MITYKDPEWPSETRKRIDADVVFCGPKDVAERLAAQLTSSTNLYKEERRAATLREKERNEKLIAEAVAQSSGEK